MDAFSAWILIAAHMVIVIHHVLEVFQHLPSGIR